jgi:hypothetical protein
MSARSNQSSYVRALGWAALASAPILLAALAVIASRPHAPASLVTHSAIAAWISGALAAVAAVLHGRGARTASRMVGGLAALVVIAMCSLLVWASIELRPRVAALDRRERAELQAIDGRLVHPHLHFSLAPLPATMRRSSSIARQGARAGGAQWNAAHRIWSWAGDDTEIAVDLTRVARADRATLQTATDELAAPLDRTNRQVHLSPRALRASIAARVAGQGHFVARVILFNRNARAYRLALTVVTREPNGWDRWLDRVQL